MRKPFSSSMIQPTGSPPGCVSSLLGGRVPPDEDRRVLGAHRRHLDARRRRRRCRPCSSAAAGWPAARRASHGLVQVARRAHRHVVHLRQRGRVGDVVEVAVADQQHVDLAEGLELLVVRPASADCAQPGVGDDHLAAGRRDLEGRLAEPQHLGLAGRGRACAGDWRRRAGCRRPAPHSRSARRTGMRIMRGSLGVNRVQSTYAAAFTTSAQRGISRAISCAEGLRRGRRRHRAFGRQLLRHVGRAERLVDLGVQPRHHAPACRRRDDAVPLVGLEAGAARRSRPRWARRAARRCAAGSTPPARAAGRSYVRQHAPARR